MNPPEAPGTGKLPSPPSEREAEAYLVARRFGQGAACPACGSRRVVDADTPDALRRWRCEDCSKSFTVVTGTVLDESGVPLAAWVTACQLLCEAAGGLQVATLAEQTAVSRTEAATIVARLRHAVAHPLLAELPTRIERRPESILPPRPSLESVVDAGAADDYLVSVRFKDGVRCPRCRGTDVLLEEATPQRRWACRACKAPFTAVTGTLLEATPPLPWQWIQACARLVSSPQGLTVASLQDVPGLDVSAAGRLLETLRQVVQTPMVAAMLAPATSETPAPLVAAAVAAPLEAAPPPAAATTEAVAMAAPEVAPLPTVAETEAALAPEAVAEPEAALAPEAVAEPEAALAPEAVAEPEAVVPTRPVVGIPDAAAEPEAAVPSPTVAEPGEVAPVPLETAAEVREVPEPETPPPPTPPLAVPRAADPAPIAEAERPAAAEPEAPPQLKAPPTAALRTDTEVAPPAATTPAATQTGAPAPEPLAAPPTRALQADAPVPPPVAAEPAALAAPPTVPLPAAGADQAMPPAGGAPPTIPAEAAAQVLPSESLQAQIESILMQEHLEEEPPETEAAVEPESIVASVLGGLTILVGCFLLAVGMSDYTGATAWLDRTGLLQLVSRWDESGGLATAVFGVMVLGCGTLAFNAVGSSLMSFYGGGDWDAPETRALIEERPQPQSGEEMISFGSIT